MKAMIVEIDSYKTKTFKAFITCMLLFKNKKINT